MKSWNLLPTLSTMAFALVSAVLIIVFELAQPHGPEQLQ
jgi:hypothetical protein